MGEAPKLVVRIAKSRESLLKLLDRIESGSFKKPDWIRLQSDCRLDRFTPDQLNEILPRIHRCVLRGFRASNVEIKSKKSRSRYWRTIARNGFHDFSEIGWKKCYDSPWIENYDYITPYRKGGLKALDPYMVYSAVLGTHDYGVEDFINTDLCSEVDTIFEPMAGTAEFSYHGHFQFPDFRYLMFDLDKNAKRYVENLRWRDNVERQYVIANVLDEEIWQRCKSFTATKSLSYLGKQSHQLFDPKQLYRLLEIGTRHVDYFMLETPQISLVSDLDEIDDVSRPEMEDAGFEVALVEEEDGAPNSFTNMMSFRLEAEDSKAERTFFRYPDWTNYQQPTLIALARLLDLQVYFYDADDEEFLSVDDAAAVEESDCLENVTFMIFTRHQEG